MSSLSNPVLWLNKSWLPHDSKTVEESFKTVCSNRGLFLDKVYTPHNIDSWLDLPVVGEEKFIQLPRKQIKVPEILLLSDYNSIPDRKVVFCRRNLWRRDHGRCQYCNKQPSAENVTIDHIHPKSKGGLSTFENCVLCCSSCNLKKGSRSLREVGMRLQKIKKHANGEKNIAFYETPKCPQWNPLYTLRRRTFPKSWAAFLKNFDESLYWEVELET